MDRITTVNSFQKCRAECGMGWTGQVPAKEKQCRERVSKFNHKLKSFYVIKMSSVVYETLSTLTAF